MAIDSSIVTHAWRAAFLSVALCALGAACGSTTGGGPGSRSTGGIAGTGKGLGGSAGDANPSGGVAMAGGRGGGGLAVGGNGSGGATSNGQGGLSAGGSKASGGESGAGGSTGPAADAGPSLGGAGGVTNAGGRTSGDGRVANGGSPASGGRSATGGVIGGGGSAGRGGAGGAGGETGSAGSTGSSNLCPSGITQTITVAKDGSGQFTTVGAAIGSIASGSSAHIRVDIKAGTYTEKLTIEKRTNLCLVGASNTTTILSYGDSNASVGSTSGSASVLISADDFSAANLTIQNTYGSGSQAVALRTTGDRQQFLNCRFVGYQDTLYTHSGMQYFKNCYVQGNTDYVFGGATALLEDCEARNVEGGSAVTAPNTDSSTAYGIVFLGGQFTAVSAVKSGSVALGRPWGAAGFAAFLNVNLAAHISAAGFVSMSGNDPQNARFHEYQSTGAGASTSSRSSYQLSASQAASYTLANILKGWTPSYSQ